MEQVGGRFLLTADHGNAEDMVQVGVVFWWVDGHVCTITKTGGCAQFGCANALRRPAPWP